MPADKLFMTVAEYARHRGTWPQTVHTWLRKGLIRKTASGLIPRIEADAALDDPGRRYRRRNPTRGRADPDDLDRPLPPRKVRVYKKQPRVKVVQDPGHRAAVMEADADTAWSNPHGYEWDRF